MLGELVIGEEAPGVVNAYCRSWVVRWSIWMVWVGCGPIRMMCVSQMDVVCIGHIVWDCWVSLLCGFLCGCEWYV
jgi:hypothetical protein